MNFINNLSIKSKLLFIIIIVAVFALGTGLALNLYQERNDLKTEMIKEAKLNATLISDFSTAQLIFDDKPTAVKTLSKLRNIPSIVFARLYKNPHINFADYGSYNEDKISRMQLNGFDKAVFDDESLLYHHKILFEGKNIGSILIIFSTKMLYQKMHELSLLTLLIASFTIILSYILARYLQKSISTPILSLADTFKEISNKHDFSPRNFQKRNDEFGILQTGLNEMLAQIRDRENEILESEKKFRNIFNSSHDALIIHGFDGKILDVNETMLKMYGVNKEEALRFTIEKDYSGDGNDLTRFSQYWEQVLSGDEIEIEWIAKQPKTGKTFDVQRSEERRVGKECRSRWSPYH